MLGSSQLGDQDQRKKRQPISQQGREVIMPLTPGDQTIDVEWHQSADSAIHLKAPEVGIGEKAVNADVIFEMPKNRWVLWTWGPRMGPAVLFWNYLIVIIIAGFVLGRVEWTPLKTRDWLLLGLGITQVNPLIAIMIVGWFLATGLRKRYYPSNGRFRFNLAQIALVVWFVAATIGLWSSIKRGLLGIPNMQISGNGSSDFLLHWTQDRIASTMPLPSVLSLHIFVFKGLMLMWALWLAYPLILKWLPWGWSCFSEGGLWRKASAQKKKEKEEKEKAPAPKKTLKKK